MNSRGENTWKFRLFLPCVILDSSSTVENKKFCNSRVIEQAKKVLALPGKDSHTKTLYISRTVGGKATPTA
jgi:hypothetical protein